MKRTKRILSMLAVSLVAVFALSCCLFAACGKDDDGGSNEHEHSWGEGVITLEPTCTEEGEMTYTCECGDTYTEKIDALGHSWYAGEITKAATCGEEGEITYTCTVCGETKKETVDATGEHQFGEWATETAATCGDDEVQSRVCSVCGTEETQTVKNTATGNHTYSEGSDIDWSWVWDDENGYSASAKVTCDVCGKAYDAEVDLRGPDDGIYGEYTATATIGGLEYTDTKTAAEDVAPAGLDIPIALDFSDPATYEGFLELDSSNNVSASSMTSGILTYVPASGSKILTENHTTGSAVTLTTGSRTKTDSNGTVGYFAIDLTSYVGEIVKISIDWTPNTDDTTETRSIFIATNTSATTVDADGVLAYGSKIGKDYTNRETVEYAGYVTADSPVIYITWDSNLCLFDMNVEIGTVEDLPETKEELYTVTVSAENNLPSVETGEELQLTATITDAEGNPVEGGTVTWTSDDENVATVSEGGLVTGVAPGTVEITAEFKSDDGDTATGSIFVTVTGEENEPETPTADDFLITLENGEVALTGEGDTASITYNVTYKGAAYSDDVDDYHVYIFSSDEGIVDVTSTEGGVIAVSTAAVSGTATITVEIIHFYTEDTSNKTEVLTSSTVSVTVTGVGPESTEGWQEKSITFAEFYDSADTSNNTIKEDKELFSDDDVKITVTAAASGTNVSIDSNNKTDPEKDTSYTHRLKLGGAGSATSRNITIETSGAAVVRFAMYSSNAAYDNIRTAQFYQYVDGINNVKLYETDDVRGFGDLTIWTVYVEEAGTYYMLGTGSINVYAIDISYEKVETPAGLEKMEIQADLSKWGFAGADMQGLDDAGIIWHYSSGAESCYTNGYLYTGEYSDGKEGQTTTLRSGTITNYFIIDLTNIEAETLSISVEFSAKDNSVKAGFMALVTELEGFTAGATTDAITKGTPLASQDVNSSNGTTKITLTAGNIDVSGYDCLYIEFSVGIRLYDISITINPDA